MDCRCCWMSLPADAHDEAVEEDVVELDEAIESRSSALSDRARSDARMVVPPGGGAGSSVGGAGVAVAAASSSPPPPEGARSCSFEPSIRAVPLPAK